MHHLLFIIWYIILNYYVSGQESATNFYKFIDSFASSTYISEESGSSAYDAKRAIQNNPNYWCSSGNHSNDDEITWTGYLNTKGFIKGVKVSWAYSPEFVKISVSSDGEKYRTIIPYKKISSNEASFDEIYFFKRLEEAMSIKIGLKNARHKYFGIREVKLIGGGNPYFLLLSGISSEEEMCLQVEEGLINNDNTSIILDSCTNALASGDGRELWKTNSNNQVISAFSDPPKCLSVVNLDDLENNKIVLYDCLRALEDGDGKSNWIFESNSQIRLQKSGDAFCISQKNIYGNIPGIHDILLNLDVSIYSNSTLDDDHNPDNTIDGNLNSYWASATFTDNYDHLVYLVLDLNKITDLSRIKIYWEYPPLHYNISVSTDNQNFTVVSENLANPSYITVDSLKNMETRYIKISMIKTHPKHGELGDNFLYGIRSIEVQANNLETVINHCRDAANSDDARDKYFVEYITEFDKDLTNKLINLEDDVTKNVSSISDNLSKLEELLPNIETCLEEKKTYDEELKESKEKANDLNNKLSLLTSVNVNTLDSDILKLGILPGDSYNFPANDCAVIKNVQENPLSGFYWIKPKCSPEPLRVYCDMDSSTSIYIWNGNPPKSPDHLITNMINSVNDIRQHCAEVGLQPLILRSKNQLNSLIISLKKIGYSLNGKVNIPLAYDYSCDHGSCSGRFHDLLNGNIDISTLIYLKASESPDSTKVRQTAGISYDDGSFKFFNLETSDISAIVCSTNSTENDSALQYLSINCETTGMEDSFHSIVNTNIVVLCPLGCDDEKYHDASIYGSRGTYSDNSSICRAAIHSDIIDNKGGLVNVTIESGMDHYVGSINNNIESISLNKNEKGLLDIIPEEKEGTNNIREESSIFHHKTIRVSSLIEDCPLDLFLFNQTSFLEKGNNIRNNKGTELKYNDDENMTVKNFHELISNLMENIDAIHGVDSSVISIVQEETIRIIEKTKKELKPADMLSKKQIEDAMNLYNLTENLAIYLYDLSSKYIQDLEKLKNTLEELKGAQKVAHNFGTFKLNYETMNFSTHFSLFDSNLIKNKESVWGYSDTNILGHENSIGQMNSVSSQEIGEGYYAKLKGLNFYDFDFNISVLSRGTGCLGVVFRAKDDFNFYLFDICDKDGTKRLSKVENGQVHILKKVVNSDVTLNNQWNKYKIITKHANIDIYEVDKDNNMIKILSSLDERFLSGTVGLYSQIYGLGTFFDDLEVIALPCTQLSELNTLNKNVKSNCPYYKENYLNNLMSYDIIYNPNNYFNWNVEKENEQNYLLCSKNEEEVKNAKDEKDIYTIVLLKLRECTDGTFNFDIQVSDDETGNISKKLSYIYILFHYKDENNFNALEMKDGKLAFLTNKNGKSFILSERNEEENDNNKNIEKRFTFVQNEWIHVNLHFDKSTFKVIIITNNNEDKFVLSAKSRNDVPLGKVGFLVHNFDEVKFDSILLNSPTITKVDENFLQVKSKTWANCEDSVHVLHRRFSCETDIYPNETKEKHIKCIKNFCKECCLYHTQLLDSNEKNECEKHCKQNDNLAAKMQTLFEKFINRCVSLNENEDYETCDKNDKKCKNKVCVLCCKKHDPTTSKELKVLPMNQFKKIQENEIIECQLQCNMIHSI